MAVPMMENRFCSFGMLRRRHQLSKDPLLYQAARAIRDIEELQSRLTRRIGPCYFRPAFNSRLRIEQFESDLDFLVGAKWSHGLDSDSRLAQIPNYAAIPLIKADIGQVLYPLTVVAPLRAYHDRSCFWRGGRRELHRGNLSPGPRKLLSNRAGSRSLGGGPLLVGWSWGRLGLLGTIPSDQPRQFVAVGTVGNEALFIKQTLNATACTHLIRIALRADRPAHFAMPAAPEEDHCCSRQTRSHQAERPLPTRLLFVIHLGNLVLRACRICRAEGSRNSPNLPEEPRKYGLTKEQLAGSSLRVSKTYCDRRAGLVTLRVPFLTIDSIGLRTTRVREYNERRSPAKNVFRSQGALRFTKMP